MKGITPSDAKVLDGKECNRLWLEFGTLARVQEFLSARGVRSPRTGKEISRPAIAMAVWRYCCQNPDESYGLELKARNAVGIQLSRTEWNVELVKHARCAYTAVGYRKWLKRNNLEEFARNVT